MNKGGGGGGYNHPMHLCSSIGKDWDQDWDQDQDWEWDVPTVALVATSMLKATTTL